MTSINPINVNTQGIGNSFGYGVKSKTEHKEAEEAKTNVNSGEKSKVAPDDVLNYMAQSAAVSAPKTIDPSKYVDKESEARIAGFIAQFEDKVAEGLKAFDQEFAGVNVSDSTKMSVVLAGIDKES